MKRVVVISDLHCGHWAGLTPPAWQESSNGENEFKSKAAKTQSEIWRFYTEAIESLKPIDVLIANGDLIDGKGERAGGTDQNTTKTTEQIRMAAECLAQTNAQTMILTYGTPYHVGKGDDWEDLITDLLDCDVHIEGHSFPKINGLQFDVKHKIGGSSVPHGRFTAIARDQLWNSIWNNAWEQQPKAGVLIRSHVHYHVYCGNPGEGWLAMTTPALQGFGSKYGVRQCSGKVDIGALVFDIEDADNYTWEPILADLPQQKVEPLVIK
jgi:hypothetical protein